MYVNCVYVTIDLALIVVHNFDAIKSVNFHAFGNKKKVHSIYLTKKILSSTSVVKHLIVDVHHT